MSGRRRSRSRYVRRRSRALQILSAAVVIVILACLTALIGWDHGVKDWLYSFSRPVVREMDLSGIYSTNAVLIEAQSGRIIGETGSEDRILPASLTKMMTVLVAIENIKDLDVSITYTASSFGGLYAEGASLAGFSEGESASLRDALYGAILPSGAECCYALAEYVSGDRASFVELMNQKAQKLGMENTHFANPTGIDDPEQYSTCMDMALLLKQGLRNRTFREVVTSQVYNTGPTSLYPGGITFYHLLFRYMTDPSVTGGEVLGGKTGYTDAAGYCLASVAEVEGREYILVTAGASGYGIEAPHVEDAKTIYNRLGAAAAGQ